MNAKEMASLFDVDPGETLKSVDTNDYDVTASDEVLASFEEKVEDMKLTMEPDPEPLDAPELEKDTEIITKAVNEAKTSQPPSSAPAPETESEPEIDPALEFDIPGDLSSEVDADLESFKKSVDKTMREEEAAVAVDEHESDGEDEQENFVPIGDEGLDLLHRQCPEVIPADISENPLQLDDDDFKVYQQIRTTYPQFTLYDGNPGYRDFYKHKFLMLRSLLSKHPLLPLKKMKEEVRQVKVDHYVGDNQIDPELIRQKLDAAYMWRTRYSTLMIDAYEQYFAWKRFTEMLHSKLAKDHYLKPAARTDGLVPEHMVDIEDYVAEMTGFIEAAKHVDTMLKAATDSLSRQLTCLQLKEATGIAVKDQPRSDSVADSLADGSVISPPPRGEVSTVDFGVTASDEFASLGM